MERGYRYQSQLARGREGSWPLPRAARSGGVGIYTRKGARFRRSSNIDRAKPPAPHHQQHRRLRPLSSTRSARSSSSSSGSQSSLSRRRLTAGRPGFVRVHHTFLSFSHTHIDRYKRSRRCCYTTVCVFFHYVTPRGALSFVLHCPEEEGVRVSQVCCSSTPGAERESLGL